MTREQEFRKQTEEAKLEAFSLMCEKVAELEKENAELKAKLNIRSCQNCRRNNISCPNDGSCNHYSKWEGYGNPQLEYAKTIIQDLLDNSDEYARERAMDFFGGVNMTEADKKLYDKAVDDLLSIASGTPEEIDAMTTPQIAGYLKGQKDFMAAAEPIGKAMYDMARDVAEGVRWHFPSKGELPEYEGFYLIYTKNNTWTIGEYEIVEGYGEWYDDSGSCEPLEDNDKVIAWRELPEPPKEKE